MPTPSVKAYLAQHGVAYETVPYGHVYAAQHVAAEAHVSGKQFAKTVIVKADDRLVMAVVPADARVDCERLKATLGAAHVELAKERDFKGEFGDCEVGAMPPFGPLFGVEVFVDESLSLRRSIVFRSGTHGELIRMAYADFARIVGPRTLALAYRR